MARTDTLTNFLTDVADAIRTKTGSQETIQASSFDTAISNIPSGSGGLDWSALGYNGIPESLENGYDYAEEIIENWNPNTWTVSNKFASNKQLIFMPLVTIGSSTTVADGMFRTCYSLLEIAQLDFSKVERVDSMFYQCTSLKKVPLLDLSSAIRVESMFSGCINLEILGGFKDLGKAYLTTANANNYSYKLELSSCSNLTHDSLMNVINNLYDIATAGVQPQQLILGSTNLAKLSAEEIAIATNKGWNVS